MNTEFIKKSIDSLVSLNDDEWQLLLDHLEHKKLKKNSYLLKEGQICNSVAFVNRGTLIYLKSQDSGKETTTDFAFEGDWVTDNRSRIDNVPSVIYIKALQETELCLIKNDNLYKCFDQIPKLERLGRVLIERAFVKVVQETLDLQTLSASQRYDKLLKEHPWIFQRMPLYHIANYLGIAPKSLSRIRKEFCVNSNLVTNVELKRS